MKLMMIFSGVTHLSLGIIGMLLGPSSPQSLSPQSLIVSGGLILAAIAIIRLWETKDV